MLQHIIRNSKLAKFLAISVNYEIYCFIEGFQLFPGNSGVF